MLWTLAGESEFKRQVYLVTKRNQTSYTFSQRFLAYGKTSKTIENHATSPLLPTELLIYGR